MSRTVKIVLAVLFALGAFYFSGPVPPVALLKSRVPVFDSVPQVVNALNEIENNAGPIKSGNRAEIRFADSLPVQTEWSIVYLHGFSASWREGAPLNTSFVSRYGCNVLLTRLYDHGIETPDPLLHMYPDSLYQSAATALGMGLALGKKVLLVGTSTGGTLALKLAADYPDKVAALVLLSPNVAINDPTAFVLNNPWGLQIARLVLGGNFRDLGPDAKTDPFWYNRYRVEGPVFLKQLLDLTMTNKNFGKVRCPVFLGYYYKDKIHRDSTVRVDAMLAMMKKLSTPTSMQQAVAFPNAGDHVIGCDITSNDWRGVQREVWRFCESKLGFKPKDKE